MPKARINSGTFALRGPSMRAARQRETGKLLEKTVEEAKPRKLPGLADYAKVTPYMAGGIQGPLTLGKQPRNKRPKF